MVDEVSWNCPKLIGTMGYITTKTSIDSTMGVVGNGVKGLASTLDALVSHEMVISKWLAQAHIISLDCRGGIRRATLFTVCGVLR